MEEIQLTQNILENAVIFFSWASQIECWLAENGTTTAGFSNFPVTRNIYNMDELYLDMKIKHPKVSGESAVSHLKIKPFITNFQEDL